MESAIYWRGYGICSRRYTKHRKNVVIPGAIILIKLWNVHNVNNVWYNSKNLSSVSRIFTNAYQKNTKMQSFLKKLFLLIDVMYPMSIMLDTVLPQVIPRKC